MLDIITQAAIKMVEDTVKPYATLTARYQPGRDVRKVLRKNPEILTRRDSKVESDIEGPLLCLWERSPFKVVPLGRVATHKVLSEDPSNPAKWQENDVVHGKYSLDATLASTDLDMLELFELLYQSRIKNYASLSLKVKLSEAEGADSIPLFYNIFCEDINRVSPIDDGEYGSLWSLDFTIGIQGYVITPDSASYAKLKDVYLSAYLGWGDKFFKWVKIHRDLVNKTLTIEDDFT